MITIEIKRDTDRQDNYKCYTIKGFLNDTTTRFHTRHGKESWQRYAVLIVGFETMEVNRQSLARMLKRIRADNRENYGRKA